MKIITIFVLIAMSEIAKGQWAAAARNLYQPILLSFGATFSLFVSDNKYETNGFGWGEWISKKYSEREGGGLKEAPKT